jgi:hypothetical protein
LANKRNQPVAFRISLENAPAGFSTSGTADGISLGPLAETARPLVILNSRGDYKGPTKLTLLIHAEPGNATIRQQIEFLGPNPRNLKSSNL